MNIQIIRNLLLFLKIYQVISINKVNLMIKLNMKVKYQRILNRKRKEKIKITQIKNSLQFNQV